MSYGAGKKMSPVSSTTLLILSLHVWLVEQPCHAFECEFTDPTCGWSWSEGFSLLSVENSSQFGATAPDADSEGDVRGQFLYYSAPEPGLEVKLELLSPAFEGGTNPTCELELLLHMYNMDMAIFKIVIKAPNSTWETTSFAGNSAHKWHRYREVIGAVSQPFSIIVEIIDASSVIPSHVAIDNLRAVDCYERREKTTDCALRQFQCSDLICIEPHQVCDTVPDCVDSEDEDQQCDQIPQGAFCTFQEDTCGWNTTNTDDSYWVRHHGETPNQRTGPSFDHTFENESGFYMMAKFPSGRSFGRQAFLKSPVFIPPPVYHRNVHSAYYNSCQLRFFYHKYGHSMGELKIYSMEVEQSSASPKAVELWRSYGNKGDLWRKGVVTLPNIAHRYYIQFSASRGVGHSDIAIDDVTLSPECFGIGVPANESLWTPDPDETVESTTKDKPPIFIRYVFGTCGAKGQTGPNDTLCNASYRDTPTKVTVATAPTLEGIQKWTVPEDGIYTLFVSGAGGGQGVSNRRNSLGSSLRATFNWKKEEIIYILVGQRGSDACSPDSTLYMRRTCENIIVKRDISLIRKMNEKRDEGGGGGGGGATYIFKVDLSTQTKTPLVIAAGGGGLASQIEDDVLLYINPNGLGINNSIAPINGFSSAAAGGGGGWDDLTTNPSSGQSLREGGRGGDVCAKASVWHTNGGFGGGGGACAAGGGAGGYRGGDAAVTEAPYFNGYGGTSYLSSEALRPSIEPGSNHGEGSAIVIPAQPGCGCEYLCVLLDLDNKMHYCICPNDLTLSIDGYSCNGQSAGLLNISAKIWVIIVLSLTIGLAVIGICVHFGLSRFRKHQNYRDLSHEQMSNPEAQLNLLRTIGGMVTENNPNYEFNGGTCSAQDLKEIQREHLTLVKALGQGAFGEVYQGYLTNPSDNSERPVAVKTLPELSSSQAVMDFLMEALIMSKFNHPNIVTFIGVCFEKMPRFIVLELLPGGDLKSFLREHRPKPQKPSTLTLSDLLKLSLDVAHGCHYLEENHFIHRDIAARNCLLTTKDVNRVVKIADFGMARDIYRADYYRKGGKAMLPVKWMPPEAFLDGIFTSKTDIWSFGVLLWEVISLGYMPYPGRGNQEVMQLVTSGGRLEPPTNCPSPVYHIMMQCWHPLPNERPNFITIIERLGYCLQDPDVINAPLPVFNRPPSMERDTTVMRPAEDESGGCLQVQRPDPSPMSPGSEDYLIPTPHSMYSLTTERSDLQSSPSLGSADQLLEMSDRRNGDDPTLSPRFSNTWETNFMTPSTPTSSGQQWPTEISSNDHRASTSQKLTSLAAPPKKRSGGYTEVPGEEPDPPPSIIPNKVQNGPRGYSKRKSSVHSVDDLPMAPDVSNDNEVVAPRSSVPAGAPPHSHSSLSLDASALARQMISGDNQPRRYINVDVNCNSGDGHISGAGTSGSLDQNVQNRNMGALDGYAGVNPVV